VVLSELDRKKYEGSSKVRERAQLVIRHLATYIDQSVPAQVRSGVGIRFLAAEAALEFVALGLDVTNQDDRLLASMVEFKAQQTEARALLVTADISFRVKAVSRKIEVVVLPDRLRLPAEPDPLEKKNNQLERELLELKHLAPRLSLCLSDGADRLLYKLTTAPILTRDEHEFQ
jgi:hypothetical protein